jgi:hypothetical protein
VVPYVTIKKIVKKVETVVKDIHAYPPYIDTHEKWITLFIFEKSYTTLRAVNSLRKQNFNTDALALSRSIIENLANLAYIFDKPEERVGLFMKYEHIEQHQALQEFENDFPEDAIDKVIREEIGTNYLKYKSLFPNKLSWSGKSIIKMLSHCSFNSDFAMVYKLSSRYLHTSIASLNDYIEIHSDPCVKKSAADIDFQKFNQDDGDLALLVSALAVLNIAEIFYRTFFSELPASYLQIQDEILVLYGVGENDE